MVLCMPRVVTVLNARVGLGRGGTGNPGTEAPTGCIISVANEYETMVG